MKKYTLNESEIALKLEKAKKKVYKGHIIHTPTREGLEVFSNHYIIVEDGNVVEIKASLTKAEAALPLVDYSDQLIIPGFIDLHVHASQYDQIGLGLDLQLIDWLNTYTFQLESKFSDINYAEGVYRNFIDELIRVGTTRAVIFATIHKESTRLLMELLEEKGISAYVGKVNMNQNSVDALTESLEASIEDTKTLIIETGDNNKVKPIVTPRFSPSCSKELLAELGKLVETYQVPVQSHLSENVDEVAWVKALFPESKHYSDTYDANGLFGQTKTLMAHGIYLGDEEYELIQKRDVRLVHCPDSNMNIKSGIMSLRKCLDMGIKVGLGSDVGGGSKLSMTSAVVSAIQNSKLKSLETGDVPIKFHEAFYLATKAGGEFFGNVGSFEKGNAFDALIVDMRQDSFEGLMPEEQLMRFVYRDACHRIKARYCDGKKIG